MQSEYDILCDVTNRLESAGVAFMLTGSMAMGFYGTPRMTRDIDLVIAIDIHDTETIVDLFESDYYVERSAVVNAIARRSIFNLIHQNSLIKVDCVILKTEPYRQEEFARRRQIQAEGFKTWIVSREDLILSKLYWAKDSRSELQLRDVRNLLSGGCDMDYINIRAKTLGVTELLALARSENERYT